MTGAVITTICVADSAVLWCLLDCQLYLRFFFYGNFKIYLTHFALLVILIIVTSLIGSYIKLFKDVSFLQAAYVICRFEFEVLWDLLLRIMARAAFLDIGAEILFNRDYTAYINFTHIFKSIIDSSTPGFDIFSTPPLANALIQVYNEKSYRSDGPFVR